MALFTQAHVDLLTSLMVMAGARYDRIRFTATDRLIAPGNPDDSGERTMAAVSPSVGVTWRAGPRFDVYGNFATSFETPTTSELANQPSGAGGFNPSLAPQRTRSVELGVNGRASWAGTAGSWQLAAYEARVNDALIPFEVPGSPGRQYFRNAGTLRNRGVEAGTSLVLPASLAVRASLTHVDSRFVRFAVTSGGVTQTYDGNRVPGVAHNRADLTLSYQPGRIFLDLDTRTSSSMPVNDANSARSDAYTIVAVRAGLLGIRAGAAELAPHVGILNLFDRPYTTSVVVNAFGGRYYEPGQPRSFYGGATLRF